MKKIFLVSIVCLLMMAFAASVVLADESDYTFKLSYSPSAGLRVGDVITVTFDLINDNNESYKMYVMQNEILFDKDYFELVADSIVVADGFVSATRDNTLNNGSVVLMNFVDMSKLGVERSAGIFVGSFQLRIINPCQDISIVNQDFYLTDAEAKKRPATGEDVTIDALAGSTPVLSANTIMPGSNAVISFTDDADWRGAVQRVEINGDSVAYTLVNGSITLAGSLFPTVGNYAIKVIATGYADAMVTQPVALRTPPALTTQTIMPGSNAVISFTDDADWRGAAQRVEIDGVSVEYTLVNGSITLAGSLFPIGGNHLIRVIAAGYADAMVAQPVTLRTPPALTTQTIVLGDNAIIDFIDDAAWRTAIERVEVDGIFPLYILDEGKMTIDGSGSLFSVEGDFIVSVFAVGYEVATVIQSVVRKTPPALTTDTIMQGSNAVISFTDNAIWCGAIQRVEIDGVSVEYTLVSGSITLAGSLFPVAGNYAIKVVATRYADATVTQQVILGTPPALAATPVRLGSNAVISFTDNAAWSGAIQRVEIDGVSVEYTLANGSITLAGSIFPAAGNYVVKVSAAGYGDTLVSQSVLPKIPPTLTANSITVGNNANITFTDDVAWRGAVQRVEVNGTPREYTLVNGRITLAGSWFPSAGNYVIRVIAEGYEATLVTQIVTAPYIPPNPPNPDDSGDEIDIDEEEVPLAMVSEHIRYIYGYEDGSFGPERNITRAEVAAIFYRLIDDSNDAGAGPYKSSFNDVVEGEWYYEAVAYLEHCKILGGYPDGTFKPNDFITRAEFAKVAALFEKLSPTVTLTFPDVPDSHWAAASILSAADKGWISGFPDGTFRPEEKITRAQVVTIINNMQERSIEKADIPADALKYPDVLESHWAYTDIIEASSEHLFTRKENGNELWNE